MTARLSWLLDSNVWHFAPIILIATSALVILGVQLGWLGHLRMLSAGAPQFATALEPVISRTFENQVVVVDGKDFQNCKFKNVTFRFRGGLYSFSGASLEGSIAFDTDNEIAQRGINLFVWLDAQTTDYWLSKNWKRLPSEHFK